MLSRLLQNGSSSVGSRQAVAVCQVGARGLSAVWVRPSNGSVRVECRQWTSPPTSQQGRFLATSRVVLLLPKSAYLIRQLDIPVGCETDAAAVIRLAAEALLPPDFGDAEVSYRRLGSREGTISYEVYLVRRSKLSAVLEDAQRLGLEAQYVLPSAWVHALMLDRAGGLDVLVDDGDERTEIALPREDGGLSVRSVSVGLNGQGDVSGEGYRQLVECLRPLVKPSRTSPIRVGWMGKPHPLEALNGQLEHLGLLERLWPDAAAQDRSLAAAACAIAQAEPRVLAEASMLPLHLRRRRQTRDLTWRLKAAVALTVAALVLSYVGLQISIARYRSMQDRLASQLESVRAEGEAVGHRIDQLRVIQKLRASRDDLTLLLSGLSQATAEGVTYSQIELLEDGQVRLRGQAQSWEQPLLLPDRLDALPMFDNVQPGNVAQVKKSGGSVVEFGLDARLRRAKP